MLGKDNKYYKLGHKHSEYLFAFKYVNYSSDIMSESDLSLSTKDSFLDYILSLETYNNLNICPGNFTLEIQPSLLFLR